MRSLSIVKFYVIIDTFCELLLGFVLCAIDFFSLHEREKRLHDSIVMELAWSGERLDNLVYVQQLAESLSSILHLLLDMAFGFSTYNVDTGNRHDLQLHSTFKFCLGCNYLPLMLVCGYLSYDRFRSTLNNFLVLCPNMYSMHTSNYNKM